VAVRQVRQPVRESDALLGRQLLAPRRLFQQRALAPVGVTLHQGALAGAVTRLFLGRAQGHPGNVTALERGCQALATSGERTAPGARKRPVNAADLEHRRPAVAHPYPRAVIRSQATAGHYLSQQKRRSERRRSRGRALRPGRGRPLGSLLCARSRAHAVLASEKDCEEFFMASDLENVLRQEAAQCRRLAELVTEQAIRQALIEMAARLEALAHEDRNEEAG
jgi:hypothetical protein